MLSREDLLVQYRLEQILDAGMIQLGQRDACFNPFERENHVEFVGVIKVSSQSWLSLVLSVLLMLECLDMVFETLLLVTRANAHIPFTSGTPGCLSALVIEASKRWRFKKFSSYVRHRGLMWNKCGQRWTWGIYMNSRSEFKIRVPVAPKFSP